MKTKIDAFLVVMLAIVGAFILYGCEPPPPKTPVYAIVAAQCSGSSHTDTDGALRDAADNINMSGGQLTVILASGHPETLCYGEEIPMLPSNDTTRLAGRMDDKDGPLAPIFQIDAAKPASEEVDYVKSIRAAASTLNSEKNINAERERVLYIIGSGIDTADEKLSFTKGVLSGDYKVEVDGMAALGMLPDLAGVTVIWYGLAQMTAEPQMPVPYEYAPKMKELWGYFLEKCGAQSVTFKDFVVPLETNTVLDGYPYVTPVLFATDTTSGYRINGTYTLPECVLKFKGNTAEFADDPDNPDPTLALGALAVRLCASEQKIVVLGTTARVSDSSVEFHRTLSMDRADRVRNELIAQGVAPENILIAGAGYEAVGVRVGNKIVDFYQNDQDDFGKQIEDIAKTNRAVHIIPFEQADEILERFGQ